MTNEELEKLHKLAMDNSELALIAMHHGDLGKYRQLSSIALTYEKKAALGLYNKSIEPSRSVLFRSAGYIALDNADFVEAQKLYDFALEGDVPSEIEEELQELKTEIDRIKTENENLIQIALTFLKNQPKPVNKEQIIQCVNRGLLSFSEKEINTKYIYGYLEGQYNIESDKHVTLEEEDYKTWIYDKKGTVDKRFWERYKEYLLKDQRWAPDTIDKLDDITDDILDHLKDPKTDGYWDKRGMVVGQVQSGKTSNYTGLICKAADYGYKIVIILAGLTNDLRSQTQLRTDIGFLGWDTLVDRSEPGDSRNFGVSSYDNRPKAHHLTTSALGGDFKSSARLMAGVNPYVGHVIMVVKKNPKVLKELISYFADTGHILDSGKTIVRNLPLLLIDDEADNASINISKNSISAVNGLIRSLLSLFQQSSYVGYTATPFANVFIPLNETSDELSRGLDRSVSEYWKSAGEDLFPKDFILNIPPPSNYIGPREIFGIDPDISATNDTEVSGLPILRPMVPEDYEQYFPDKHKKDDALPDNLPEKLKDAIKAFILVCAIRRARGQVNKHNSMLVHVTRFIRWQNRVANLISKQLKFYQKQIQYSQGNLVTELKELYESDFKQTTFKIINESEIDDSSIEILEWFEVEAQLKKAALKIRVRAIHGDSGQEGLEFDNINSLDYYMSRDTGLSVIAVGGNKLSRGLTLEGLSVSFYLRATQMYDTLMQMGRWFGYRPGYADLCRLYTSEELIRWYKYITVASEEIRAEFEEMKMQRRSPRKFGIKVRQHPDVLKITATNKMRSSQQMTLSFSDKLRETWMFKRDKKIFKDNYTHAFSFINSLGLTARDNEQHFIWEKNADDVIRFLSGYKSDDELEKQKIVEYIDAQVKAGFLTDWTIVLISTKRDKKDNIFKIDNSFVPVGLTMRADSEAGTGQYYQVSRSHIIDPSHEYLDFDLNSPEFIEAIRLTVADWEKSERTNKRPTPPDIPTGKNIRALRPVTKGLLLLYPLDPTPEGWNDSGVETPIIGYAISFPKNDKDKKISYTVNQVFMSEYDYEDTPEVSEINLEQ